MDPEYGRHYSRLYSEHWWWRAREEIILNVLERRFGGRSDLKILDVGCGDGLFFDRLQKFGDVDGIEPAEDIVDPRGRHRSKIMVARFDHSFRPSSRYSLILMLDVLEHLAKPREALSYARELLEPAGLLLVTVPAFQGLWTQHDVLNQHHTRFTREGFRQIAEEAGIRPVEMRYFFLWLALAKLIVKLKERVAGSKPEVPRLPSRWLNQLLLKLSCVENRIALVVSFPFGSSLLVVGAADKSAT